MEAFVAESLRNQRVQTTRCAGATAVCEAGNRHILFFRRAQESLSTQATSHRLRGRLGAPAHGGCGTEPGTMSLGWEEGGSCGSGERWMDEGSTGLPVRMDVG